jgi:hypothetical protein
VGEPRGKPAREKAARGRRTAVDQRAVT